MVTAKKADGTTEKTLIFVIKDMSKNFEEKLTLLLKSLENIDSWFFSFFD